jgi:hypothetical protein
MKSVICAPALFAVAEALYGQQIISAQSGLLNHMYLAAANVSAAQYVHGLGVSYASSAWVWNAPYRAYTFLPLSGSWRNFWGFEYHSPGGPAVRASAVDSLSAAQQRRDALAAASKQTDPCMTRRP